MACRTAKKVEGERAYLIVPLGVSVRRRDEVDTRRESGTTRDLLLFVVAPEESERLTGFVPFFEQKIQGLSRTRFPFVKDSI